MAGTTVIIPFYQNEAGLLPKAIRSVLAQENAGDLTIVVCDDSSPSPAELDLDRLDPKERERVVLVRQPNAGCGFARNGAMDAMPEGAEWIAYIDSDDEWSPSHLSRALAALDCGYDLFFADARREHEMLTTFQGAGFEPRLHRPITTLPGVYGFEGDFLTQLVEQPPIPISSVVVRASLLGTLRFQQLAFEDILYFFAAAQRGARFAFSDAQEVLYGKGNITVADDWASQRELKNCLSYQRTFKQVWREQALTSAHRSMLRRRFSRNRRTFCGIVLGLLRRGQLPAGEMVKEFLLLDPRLPLSALTLGAALAMRPRRSPAG